LITFYEKSIQAVRAQDRPSTWSKVRYGGLANLYVTLTRMKFVPPNQTPDALRAYFASLQKEILEGFKKFRET